MKYLGINKKCEKLMEKLTTKFIYKDLKSRKAHYASNGTLSIIQMPIDT